jgi:hypothetical protein
MKKIKFVLPLIFLSFLLLFNSCSLRPVSSEYAFLDKNTAHDLNNLGNGKIIIYNGDYYCPTITCGITTKLNIWLDNKPLGQINYGEFVIINLENGNHNFEVLHLDVFKMRSEHSLEITNETRIIKIKPTIFSNSVKITNVLPNGFFYYNYAPQHK